MVKTQREGEKTMAISDAEAKWKKENTVVIAIRLQKRTDADILDYLKDKRNQTVIKLALREYIENHPEE